MAETTQFAFTPRPYQVPVLKYFANGGKRGISVWHRRAGKDLTILNLAVIQALKRVGAVYYFFPTYAQGKKIIWQGRDKDGKRFLDYIPPEIVAKDPHTGRLKINETDLRIEFENGSSLQIIGTDNMDSIVGTNPVGCIFSEYSLMNPRAWDLTRPILRENGGWAHFVYTPRGRNHAYRLFKAATKNKRWFVSHLSIDETRNHDGKTPILYDSLRKDHEQWIKVLGEDVDINEDRVAGMDEDLINSEYYVSFDGSTEGSYYGRLLARLYADDRCQFYAWNPNFPVYTSWDLGVGDSTAIWFFQLIGNKIIFIDYYEKSDEGLEHFRNILHAEHRRDWYYERHYMPHDVEHREKSTGKTLKWAAQKLGIKPITVVTKLAIEHGIQAVRHLFPRFHFDEKRCQTIEYKGHSALDCVQDYRKEWDEDKQCFKDKPLHDWTSHACDALRVAALAIKDVRPQFRESFAVTRFNVFRDRGIEELKADTDFDPLSYDQKDPYYTAEGG